MSRTLLRAGTLLGTTALIALAGAAPAFAHVTANPSTVQKGGYGVVTFRVPNEDDTAGTVAVTVNLPPDHPFSSVRTTPDRGLDRHPQRGHAQPAAQGRRRQRDHEDRSARSRSRPTRAPGSDRASTWTSRSRSARSPTTSTSSACPSSQTYDNGKVVNWADPPNADGSEPEHPAPSVALTAATGDHARRDERQPRHRPIRRPSDDTTARWLGGAGLLVGALGLGFGGGAVLRTRRAGKSD